MVEKYVTAVRFVGHRTFPQIITFLGRCRQMLEVLVENIIGELCKVGIQVVFLKIEDLVGFLTLTMMWLTFKGLCCKYF